MRVQLEKVRAEVIAAQNERIDDFSAVSMAPRAVIESAAMLGDALIMSSITNAKSGYVLHTVA